MAGQALDVLSALVDKSLVMKEDVRGVAAYRLHETMREYASLKLRDAAEEEVLDERYVEYYRMRCRDAEDDARHRTLEWLQWVELEIDNIRSVLQRCLAASDWQTRARARHLHRLLLGHPRHHREHALVRRTARPLRRINPDVPARAYHFRGWLSMLQIEPEAARPWLARAIAAARASGELSQLSESLSTASTAEHMAGDGAAARQLLDEAEALAPRVAFLRRVDRADPGPSHSRVLRGRS